MRRKSGVWAALLFLLTALPFLPMPAQAWGEDGHAIVCALASQQLSEDARQEVDRLVEADGEFGRFEDACSWADRPRKRPSEHYVNYDRSVVAVDALTEPKSDPNVITAIVEDAERLADRELSDEERAEALFFLGHWVGDIHQPLHVSFKDDRGGNSVDKAGRCSARNLHAVWDSCIVIREIMGIGPSEWRLEGVRQRARDEAVRRLAKVIPAYPREHDRQRLLSAPWVWAGESYAVATHPRTGYCVRLVPWGLCRYGFLNPTYEEDEAQRTISMDEAYTVRMKPVVEERLLAASVRLTELIETVLAN